jgi:hypothetical protein
LAVCAFVIHGARLLLLDKHLEREMALAAAENDLPLPPQTSGQSREESAK